MRSQTIEAISATPEMAELLAIGDDAALLYIERISYSEFGVPVEYLQLYHRGDRYSLHADCTVRVR